MPVLGQSEGNSFISHIINIIFQAFAEPCNHSNSIPLPSCLRRVCFDQSEYFNLVDKNGKRRAGLKHSMIDSVAGHIIDTW